MIKVTFTDGTSKNYRIGARRLGETEWNYLNRDNAAKVAAILMTENVRSVNAKYGDNEANSFRRPHRRA